MCKFKRHSRQYQEDETAKTEADNIGCMQFDTDLHRKTFINSSEQLIAHQFRLLA